MSINWINSLGGPLILMQSSALQHWTGSDESYGMTDYERACEVADYIGVIDCGNSDALVLSGEPMATAYVPDARFGGTIVRWMYAESEPDFVTLLKSIADPYDEPAAELLIRDRRCLLFDSVMSTVGGPPDESIVVDLIPGRYLVYTIEYSPDPSTCFILHQLWRHPVVSPNRI